mmetsp:Transcript_31695/g.51254  ORF Transcript_31695/g.51254 Transcript_31695/m.51254 type:complete len:104 (+) Transcript_31695:2212-2523(+)
MAEFNVALCYQKGNGVEENFAIAIEWYNRAAEHGFEQAQCNLGVFYQQGIGVAKDEMRACKWYITAAAQVLAFQLIRDWQSNGTPKHLFRVMQKLNSILPTAI